MFFALITAHVITDFVFQPDWMASAKKQNFLVLVLHALITGLGAMVIAWLYWPQLWKPAIILAIIHLIVDWIKIRVDTCLKQGALATFLADQIAHILSIMGVLMALDLIEWNTLAGFIQALMEPRHSLLTYTFAYSTSVFFGYVLLKILLLNLPTDEVLDDGYSRKYIGMLERGLITSCVALGHFLLIGAVVAPRLLFESMLAQNPVARQRLGLEVLVNVVLAMSVGLILLP